MAFGIGDYRSRLKLFFFFKHFRSAAPGVPPGLGTHLPKEKDMPPFTGMKVGRREEEVMMKADEGS